MGNESFLHAYLCEFGHQVLSQIKQRFIPPIAQHRFREDFAWVVGGAPVTLYHRDGSTFRYHPDSQIVFFEPSPPVIVFEVAVSQHQNKVKHKAFDFISLTRGMVRVVIVINVNLEVQNARPRTEAGNTTQLGAHDTVTVSVYQRKTMSHSPPQGQWVVNDACIWPELDLCSFKLDWQDLNRGSWDNKVIARSLPPGTAVPECEIQFEPLFSFIQRLVNIPEEDCRDLEQAMESLALTGEKYYSQNTEPLSDSSSASEGSKTDGDYEPDEEMED